MLFSTIFPCLVVNQPEHMVVDADGVPLVEESGDAPEDEGKHAANESSLKIHKFKK